MKRTFDVICLTFSLAMSIIFLAFLIFIEDQLSIPEKTVMVGMAVFWVWSASYLWRKVMEHY